MNIHNLPFVLKNHLYNISYLSYIPNLRTPKTFNEKIQYRKKNWKDKRIITCSDKVKVKDYVANAIGTDFIIDNLYVGDSIDIGTLTRILEHNNGAVVKANHNSGPVYVLSGEEELSYLKFVCADINKQLTKDFGKKNGEGWYSHINRKVLVERRLECEEKSLLDYKFHIFSQENGEQNCILHVDFDRGNNHNRSFFTEELEWLPFSVMYPAIRTKIAEPENYSIMLQSAKKLAEKFPYVRIDFYNLNGKIYFGEMTFAHEAGYGTFTNKSYDKWFGNFWDLKFENKTICK